jgi:hypothetical protein
MKSPNSIPISVTATRASSTCFSRSYREYQAVAPQVFLWWAVSILLLFLAGCATRSNMQMPEPPPSIVKIHKSLTLRAGTDRMISTGVALEEGDTFTIFATGRIDFWPKGEPHFKYHNVTPELGWPLMLRVGDGAYFGPLMGGSNSYTQTFYRSGEIFVGYKQGKVDFSGKPKSPHYYLNDMGSFVIDIIVWQEKDWVRIYDFLAKMKERNPANKAVSHAFTQAQIQKHWYVSSLETAKQIQETKEKIAELKQGTATQAPKTDTIIAAGKPAVQAKSPDADIQAPSKIEPEKLEKVSRLEEKLKKLNETMAQLEEMEKKLEAERKKSTQLAEALAEKNVREQELLEQLKGGANTPPVIVVASPREGSRVDVNVIHLSGVAEDADGLTKVEIFINGKPLEDGEGSRGFAASEGRSPKRLAFRKRILLEKGENRIQIRAVDRDGLSSHRLVTVQRVQRRQTVWAVIIGIDDYTNIRRLKYAVEDARLVYDLLVNLNRVPAANVTLLLNENANLTRLRSVLGTQLKKMAGKDDMVIIYFAGHGATEKDVMSPDGDGLEKYLLPHGADPEDLYATALPMGEISKIFYRIRSERLVFIADACYSGASGGRTIGISGIRANLSEDFLDRITSGKGRVIISASGVNEVSAENDKLGHGVFTHYLALGWRGAADSDRDGLITVDELYRYVSEHVPRATGQEQHPVKKGTMEGHIVLGIVD